MTTTRRTHRYACLLILILFLSSVICCPAVAAAADAPPAKCGRYYSCTAYERFSECLWIGSVEDLEYPFGELGYPNSAFDDWTPESVDKFYKISEYAAKNIDILDEYDYNRRTDYNHKWTGGKSTPIEALEHCICECDLYADAMYEMISAMRGFPGRDMDACTDAFMAGLSRGLAELSQQDLARYTYHTQNERLSDDDMAYMIDRMITHTTYRGITLNEIEDTWCAYIIRGWGDAIAADYADVDDEYREKYAPKITKQDVINLKKRLHELYKCSKTGQKQFKGCSEYIIKNYDEMLRKQLAENLAQRIDQAMSTAADRHTCAITPPYPSDMTDADWDWWYAGTRIGWEDGYMLGVSGLGIAVLPPLEDFCDVVDFKSNRYKEFFVGGYYGSIVDGHDAGALISIRDYIANPYKANKDDWEKTRENVAFGFHCLSIAMDFVKIAVLVSGCIDKTAGMTLELLRQIARSLTPISELYGYEYGYYLDDDLGELISDYDVQIIEGGN